MTQEETDAAIQAILDRHHIAPNHRGDFNYLIEEGEIDSPDFRRRIRHQVNYTAALEEIMELLSKPFYQLTVSGPRRFESLNLSDFPPLGAAL